MSTTIEAAQLEDAGFIAWVNLTAHRSHLLRGFWDFYVGGNETQCLHYLEVYAKTATPHWGHYSAYLIAKVNGKVAAGLCGYFEEELGGNALRQGAAEADTLLGRTREDAMASVERIASIRKVAPEHSPGVWIVEHVATRPEYRRKGLISSLMSEILEKGRQRGATLADISVLIGNDPAQKAYEKAGFHVTGEKCDPEFERVWGCPGVRNLQCRL